MIISQLPIYLLCFLLGWLPLYAGYRWLESSVPFKLVNGKTKFSYFSFFVFDLYDFRGCACVCIMIIVHDFLVYDFDLIFGVFIWLLGMTWPPFVPSKYRSSHWLSLFGIYLYLVPMIAWVWPIGLVTLFFLGMGAQYRLPLISLLFFCFSVINGFNSLYLLLFFLIGIYAVIVTQPKFRSVIG